LERLAAIEDLYTERLEGALDRARMELLPGVLELLRRLVPRPDLEVALLTGNWERGARSKLARFDLNGFFPWGAFGGDGIDREELPPVAWRKAHERTGRRFAPDETLIIGDSLQDIACAHAHGIPVLAVETGSVRAAALLQAGADFVVSDLRAAESQVEWLG
jgi:phosphoglycolate phosphatase-like HAD superfamily hydrolase